MLNKMHEIYGAIVKSKGSMNNLRDLMKSAQVSDEVKANILKQIDAINQNLCPLEEALASANLDTIGPKFRVNHETYIKHLNGILDNINSSGKAWKEMALNEVNLINPIVGKFANTVKFAQRPGSRGPLDVKQLICEDFIRLWFDLQNQLDTMEKHCSDLKADICGPISAFNSNISRLISKAIIVLEHPPRGITVNTICRCTIRTLVGPSAIPANTTIEAKAAILKSSDVKDREFDENLFNASSHLTTLIPQSPSKSILEAEQYTTNFGPSTLKEIVQKRSSIEEEYVIAFLLTFKLENRLNIVAKEISEAFMIIDKEVEPHIKVTLQLIQRQSGKKDKYTDLENNLNQCYRDWKSFIDNNL